MHAGVRSNFQNMNIFAIKFYLKHHWGEGKAALGFGQDPIRTLVSMATYSSHRVIMGKNSVATFSQLFFIRSFLYLQPFLQVTRTCMKAWRSLKLGQI